MRAQPATVWFTDQRELHRVLAAREASDKYI